VTQEANDRYFAEMMRKRHRTGAAAGWPTATTSTRTASTIEAYWRSRRLALDDYEFTA
jgi:cyclohexanone monooxygenase